MYGDIVEQQRAYLAGSHELFCQGDSEQQENLFGGAMREGAGISPLAVRAANMDGERFRVYSHVPVAAGCNIRKPAAYGFAESGRYGAMGLLLRARQE